MTAGLLSGCVDGYFTQVADPRGYGPEDLSTPAGRLQAAKNEHLTASLNYNEAMSSGRQYQAEELSRRLGEAADKVARLENELANSQSLTSGGGGGGGGGGGSGH